jgi:O-6-methylguanine DNA methyltransferase
MTTQKSKNEVFVVKHLRSALGSPTEIALSRSRERVKKWFTEEAPLIQWGEMSSPLGPLFAAVNERGLCALDFGRKESEFLERFDSRARLEKNSNAVQRVLAQLREYFAGGRSNFNLPVDISQLTPFQRSVLDVACRIAPGQVWTYQRIAEELGRPRSSRPVGGALARNPIPIVIPCHRVVASDGSLGGYSGGSGLKAKRWLLRLEGAL